MCKIVFKKLNSNIRGLGVIFFYVGKQILKKSIYIKGSRK